MPELNGVEMARCIRAINPDVKVVYMRGAVDDYRSLINREAMEFGAKIVRKPFTRNSLVEQLRGVEDDRTPPGLLQITPKPILW